MYSYSTEDPYPLLLQSSREEDIGERTSVYISLFDVYASQCASGTIAKSIMVRKRRDPTSTVPIMSYVPEKRVERVNNTREETGATVNICPPIR